MGGGTPGVPEAQQDRSGPQHLKMSQLGTPAPCPDQIPTKETRMNDRPGFEEIMRRLHSRSPEERVLMSAQTEVEMAEGQIRLEIAVGRMMNGEDPELDDMDP